MESRRSFLRKSLVVAGVSAGNLRSSKAERLSPSGAVRPLRILILGGTGFIGPHQVRYALDRGHQLTLFNRGKTNPHLFPEVEKLRGDRNDDLESLRGGHWDVVIDNSASIPRWVRQSTELLRESAAHYIYVSSISVYSDNSIIGMDETAPVGTLDDPTVEEITGTTFGPLKALCEQEARRVFGERCTVIRPGLIVGPGDRSDRFTYWPVRIDRGGEVLAPGNPTDPVQIIDARDLAQWMIRMAEGPTAGTFNATGPGSLLSMAEMLYGIRAVTSSEVSFTWVDAAFLSEHEVQPWADMPVWVPPTEGMEGFSRVDCSAALSQGLTFRPLAETSRDTIDWFKTLPEERRKDLRAGIDPAREVEVLRAWKARNQS